MQGNILPPPINGNDSCSGNVEISSQKRSVGLDIVRTIACVTVIISHFFLFTKFNKVPFEGISLYLQGMLNSLPIGSDLYMMLTGFLCMNKVFGKSFYKSGLKVVISYVFISLLTIAVNRYYFGMDMSWSKGLMGILSFSTIPYAWYIEMWIGLFLLSPFFNILYKAIPSKRQKQAIILILFFLTALPDFGNRYGLYIFPAYWEDFYPLMFYLIGCYIREYQPNISKWKLAVFALVLVNIAPLFNLIISHDDYIHIIGDRNGIVLIPLSVTIFLMFYNVSIKSEIGKTCLKGISLRSLDIFLCSAVFDHAIYPYFISKYFVDQSQFGAYIFIIIPLIFGLSFTIATIKRALFKGIEWLIAKVRHVDHLDIKLT